MLLLLNIRKYRKKWLLSFSDTDMSSLRALRESIRQFFISQFVITTTILFFPDTQLLPE